MSIDTHKGSNNPSSSIYIGNTQINKIMYRENIVYQFDETLDIITNGVINPDYSFSFSSYPTTGYNISFTQNPCTLTVNSAPTPISGYYQGIYIPMNRKIVGYELTMTGKAVAFNSAFGIIFKNPSQYDTGNGNSDYGNYYIWPSSGYVETHTISGSNLNLTGEHRVYLIMTNNRAGMYMTVNNFKLIVR